MRQWRHLREGFPVSSQLANTGRLTNLHCIQQNSAWRAVTHMWSKLNYTCNLKLASSPIRCIVCLDTRSWELAQVTRARTTTTALPSACHHFQCWQTSHPMAASESRLPQWTRLCFASAVPILLVHLSNPVSCAAASQGALRVEDVRYVIIVTSQPDVFAL